MLREVRKVLQKPGEPKRRWFNSKNFDLFVWMRKKEIVGFQLTYDKKADEHALSWWKDSGFHHHRVDDGEGKPGRYKASPILESDGVIDGPALAERFRQESTRIDKKISSFVLEKILQVD